MKTIIEQTVKTLFVLFFLTISLSVQGQENELWKKYYPLCDISPKEMKEDIDHYFNTLEKAHANMYALISKDSLLNLKKRLYSECSQPMKIVDFNRYLMRLSTVLDGHTGIIFIYKDEAWGTPTFFPDAVKIEKGELILLTENMDKAKKIESINGMSASHIYDMTVNKNEIKANREMMASGAFAKNLYYLTLPPFNVVVQKENKKDTLTINGVPLKDAKKIYQGQFGNEPLSFRKYPDQSIAIIDYNSCSYNLNDEKVQEKLESEFGEIFKQIDTHKIKHLFIDISRNGGGNSGTNKYLLSHIYAPKAVNMSYSIKKRFDPYNPNGPIYLDSLSTYTYTDEITANPKGYKGNIYLIQGRITYSAAMGGAEWFKKSGRATIIGEETGQATACYIDSYGGFELPNSHILFYTSFKDWKALPDGQYNMGVQPDVPVKLDYEKSRYELDDLQNFLKEIKQHSRK